MPRLSVSIITKNEAGRIGRCLAAVAWADEIVVLDSGSTDATADIARQAGARVEITADWPGFGAQKNRALDLCTGDWILALDADETVTPRLAHAIRAAVTRNDAVCWGVKRVSTFLGHTIRWGDWRNDVVWRLFPRGRARFSEVPVHERLDGPLPQRILDGELLHETYRTLEDVHEKTERYAALGAQQLRARGRSSTRLEPSLRAGWAFARCYLLRRGFLDGAAGLMLARMQAAVTFRKYAKLRQAGAERHQRPG